MVSKLPLNFEALLIIRFSVVAEQRVSGLCIGLMSNECIPGFAREPMKRKRPKIGAIVMKWRGPRFAQPRPRVEGMIVGRPWSLREAPAEGSVQRLNLWKHRDDSPCD